VSCPSLASLYPQAWRNTIVNALFATHLQKDLGLAPGLVATPIFFANLGSFLSTCGWGWWADRFGRRSAIIIPALIALPLAPLYLLSTNFLWVAVGFIAQGMCAGGGMHGQMVPYLWNAPLAVDILQVWN
jgi:MFS transporter, SHS family, lactate transporter